MKNSSNIIFPENYDEALTVIGTSITVLLSNSQTNSHEITIQSGEEGMGPPPHSHGWDESFFVLEGTVLFSCNGESAICSKGSLVHVPADTVHAFRYGKGGGKFLEIAGKGANATKMFKDMSNEIPPGPPDIQKVLEVFGRNGVTAHLQAVQAP